MIHAMEPLLDGQLVAVRTTTIIDPGSFIVADGVDAKNREEKQRNPLL